MKKYFFFDIDGTLTNIHTGKLVESGLETLRKLEENGHFVAIVGITADDKLVIANPARGNGRGNVFNADTVLRYSNKAISVSK